MKSRLSHDRIFLLALLVAGLALRTFVLFSPGFYREEAALVARAALPSSHIVVLSCDEGTSPLFPALVHTVMRVAMNLGPDLVDLRSLRLLSWIFGIASILLAGLAARRWWGAGAAVIATGLFATLPPLVLASGLAMATALSQFLTLAAAIAWLSLATSGKPRWPAASVYVASMAAAVATEPWAIILLMSCIVIATADRFAGHQAGHQHAWQLFSAFAPLLLALCYFLFLSRAATAAVPGFQFHFLGFWGIARTVEKSIVFESSNPVLIGGDVAVLLLAPLFIVASIRYGRAAAGVDRPLASLVSLAAGLFACWLAALIARADFAATLFAVALPVWILWIARLLAPADGVRIISPRSAIALALSAGASIWAVVHYPVAHSSPAALRELALIDLPLPSDTIIWTNEQVAPWLGRGAPFTLHSPDQLSQVPIADRSRPVYFIAHEFAGLPPFAISPRTQLLEHILDDTPAAIGVPVPEGWYQWKKMWVIRPASLPEIEQRLAAALAQRPRALQDEGGQVLLPSDPAIQYSLGWSVPELSAQDHESCWSIGDEQTIGWRGPTRPGKFSIELHFWRPHPLPTLAYAIEYQLPGQTEWRTQLADLGAVAIRGEFETTQPRQPLLLRLRIPSWEPWRHLPDTTDPRHLGIQLLRVEIKPAS